MISELKICSASICFNGDFLLKRSLGGPVSVGYLNSLRNLRRNRLKDIYTGEQVCRKERQIDKEPRKSHQPIKLCLHIHIPGRMLYITNLIEALVALLVYSLG